MRKRYWRRHFSATKTGARVADSIASPSERYFTENIEAGASRPGIRRSFVLSLSMLLGLAGVFSAGSHTFAMMTTAGPVQTIDQYFSALEKVNARHAIAIIDVAAEWCDFCGTINNEILKDPRIVRLLNAFAIVRVDVTHMDAANRSLMKFLVVDGPPTLFLIDTATGREFKGTRSVGWFDVENLAVRLRPFVGPPAAMRR